MNRLAIKAYLEDWSINKKDETINDSMNINRIFKHRRNNSRRNNYN